MSSKQVDEFKINSTNLDIRNIHENSINNSKNKLIVKDNDINKYLKSLAFFCILLLKTGPVHRKILLGIFLFFNISFTCNASL